MLENNIRLLHHLLTGRGDAYLLDWFQHKWER